jgi:hypothetical protein
MTPGEDCAVTDGCWRPAGHPDACGLTYAWAMALLSRGAMITRPGLGKALVLDRPRDSHHGMLTLCSVPLGMRRPPERELSRNGRDGDCPGCSCVHCAWRSALRRYSPSTVDGYAQDWQVVPEVS